MLSRLEGLIVCSVQRWWPTSGVSFSVLSWSRKTERVHRFRFPRKSNTAEGAWGEQDEGSPSKGWVMGCFSESKQGDSQAGPISRIECLNRTCGRGLYGGPLINKRLYYSTSTSSEIRRLMYSFCSRRRSWPITSQQRQASPTRSKNFSQQGPSNVGKPKVVRACTHSLGNGMRVRTLTA